MSEDFIPSIGSSFTIITLTLFLMFYLPLMEPRAKMEQDDVEFLQDKQDGLRGNLSVSFKKSLLRVLERIAIHYMFLNQLLARLAGRKMPTLVYFCSVTKTTFRGYMLGISASWNVQVGIRLFQFFESKSKNQNDNVNKVVTII
ncbi:hypothetical protein HKD37_18G049733 [Glycine soja]